LIFQALEGLDVKTKKKATPKKMRKKCAAADPMLTLLGVTANENTPCFVAAATLQALSAVDSLVRKRCLKKTKTKL
jgi:hypothetical protein